MAIELAMIFIFFPLIALYTFSLRKIGLKNALLVSLIENIILGFLCFNTAEWASITFLILLFVFLITNFILNKKLEIKK